MAALRFLPSFLDLRRLEGRIVALFLALLLVVQLASFAMIRQGSTAMPMPPSRPSCAPASASSCA